MQQSRCFPRVLICSILFSLISFANSAQVVNWVFLPEGESTNNFCTSTSNYENGQVCYGVEYLPNATGLMTSYTMGFLIDCPASGSASILSESCTLDDNSVILDACDEIGQVLLQASGNDATFPVTAGVPLVVHKVCMDFHFLDSLDIIIDPITGISVSIDTDGGAVSDFPPFDPIKADYSPFGVTGCGPDAACGINFGSLGGISLDTNAMGQIIVGDPTDGNDEIIQSFDVYDEVNKLCGIDGGEDDITLSLKMIHTYDIYNNGVANDFVGDAMYIEQDSFGINAIVPFGAAGLADGSSTGDVRGYEMKVDFAPHITILAGQLDLILKEINQGNSVFESAYVRFYGPEGYAYGAIDYTGYYTENADLTGNCNPTTVNTPYTIAGKGIMSAAQVNAVDLSNPCSPTAGAMSQDTLIINASTEGDLHPEDIITGFSITVIGEDIAAPDMLDNGSGINGEDNIAGNRITNTSTSMMSSILGYQVDGCVFTDPLREEISIDVFTDSDYLSRGDSVLYTIRVINNLPEDIDSVDIELQLSQDIINAVTSVGGVITNDVVFFDNLDIAIFDTIYLTVLGYVSPSIQEEASIVDIVDGSSVFVDASYHHSSQPWVVNSTQPRSGTDHWYTSSDADMVVKYLELDEIIVPQEGSQLSFWHIYDLEDTQDGGQIEYSLDNGLTWISFDAFTQNGYNSYQNDDASDLAFSGNSTGYVQSSIDLTPFEDMSMKVRFKLYSNYAGAEDGWYIDDIEITPIRENIPLDVTGTYNDQTVNTNLFPVSVIAGCTEVYDTKNVGQGTLRRAVACADLTDTITFLNPVIDRSVQLDAAIILDKNLVIDAENQNVSITQSDDATIFQIANNTNSKLEGLSMIHSGQSTSQSISVDGNLIIKNISILKPPNSIEIIRVNSTGSLTTQGANSLSTQEE